MIILCSKSFAGKGAVFERDFLMYYLSKVCNKPQKAFVANEVWEAFRFRVLENSDDKEVAERIIATFRGTFSPEDLRLNDNFDEQAPKKDYDEQELIERTRSFVDRKWADVEFFITQEPEKYSGLKVKIRTLGEFYVECMNDDKLRTSIIDFSIKTALEK